MKKILIISLFVLAMIIPNINVKAVDVSNEEELRNAIEQGGDITLTQNIEVTQPLVIDKDVNIDGEYKAGPYYYHRSIESSTVDTLITVNSRNVTLDDVNLYAGWNGVYSSNQFTTYPDNVVKGQGTALVVNGGTVNFDDVDLYAGNVGMEVNGGTVTGSLLIHAGERNYNVTYSGGQGMIINGGSLNLYELNISSGGTALTVNNGLNITLNGTFDINSYEGNGLEVNDDCNIILSENINIKSYGGDGIKLNDVSNVTLIGYFDINSYEGNGIKVNDGVMLNINSTNERSDIFGSKNAIYLNGGTVNLSGRAGLSSSTSGYGIYINKGINTNTNGHILNLKNDFVFSYGKETTPNFSIYVNPDITELRVTDEKEFFELLDNKLNLGFCGSRSSPMSQSEEDRKTICSNLGSNYDGPIESNELGKCTTVYINGEKQNEVDASCTPVIDNDDKNEPSQIVNVPATSAYASIIIIVLGIICIIVSVIVTRRVINKKQL